MTDCLRMFAKKACVAVCALGVAAITLAQATSESPRNKSRPPTGEPLPVPIVSQPANPIPTFVEFEAATLKLPNGKYVVDGDIPIYGEKALYQWYQENIARVAPLNRLEIGRGGVGPTTELAIKTTSGGADAMWNNTQKRNLTYCIDTEFQNYGNNGFGGSDFTAVRNAIQRAAEAWEGIADVDFIYMPNHDLNCANNSTVLFRVIPYVPLGINDGLVAAAFFPDDPVAARTLDVNVKLVPDPGLGKSLSGVMMHELGHILGFVHEQIRPEVGGLCPEGSNWRALTVYDQSSVMHYRGVCHGISGDYFITNLDRTGVRAIYGAYVAPPPPNLAPVALIGMPVYSGYAGNLTRFDGSGSYDPEGHVLTYTWSFGDGTSNAQTSTNYIDHTYSAQGTYSVTLTVSDGSLTSAVSSTSASIVDIRWLPSVLRIISVD